MVTKCFFRSICLLIKVRFKKFKHADIVRQFFIFKRKCQLLQKLFLASFLPTLTKSSQNQIPLMQQIWMALLSWVCKLLQFYVGNFSLRIEKRFHSNFPVSFYSWRFKPQIICSMHKIHIFWKRTVKWAVTVGWAQTMIRKNFHFIKFAIFGQMWKMWLAQFFLP